MLEIDQIFVVLENLDVRECAPGVLNLLCSELVFRFLSEFAAPFLITAPGPLDLDSRDMIHGEAVVLEESPGQGHLVRRLNQSSTKVSHTLLFVLSHHVERRRQKLLPQALCS